MDRHSNGFTQGAISALAREKLNKATPRGVLPSDCLGRGMPRQIPNQGVGVNPKINHAGKSTSASFPQNKTAISPSLAWSADQILPDDIRPLRLKTIAQFADVSEKTVRRWIQRGLLRSYKLGGARVACKGDVRTFLDQQAGKSNKERP
jgi:hypothetical protein